MMATDEANSRHEGSLQRNASISPRRILAWGMIVTIVIAVIVFADFRFRFLQKRAEIDRLGGSTVAGPPLLYRKMKADSRYPEFVRIALNSNFGSWVFDQFPVVYSVDLRRIRDPEKVDRGLEIAAEFGSVLELVLYQSAVTDAHLAKYLHSFPQLLRLKLNETTITDAGIAHVRNLPELELLNVQRTALTNAAVPDLAAVSKLGELDIAETKITDVDAIRHAHPRCKIIRRTVTLTDTTDRLRIKFGR